MYIESEQRFRYVNARNFSSYLSTIFFIKVQCWRFLANNSLYPGSEARYGHSYLGTLSEKSYLIHGTAIRYDTYQSLTLTEKADGVVSLICAIIRPYYTEKSC